MVENWNAKTQLGKKVQAGEVTSLDNVLDNGNIILEPEIVDSLAKVESELLLIGQSKGKFGGGKRRVFRQTQKKTREGNKPKFATLAVVGNKDGIVGLGYGKSKETVPAREKGIRSAKLNVFKIRRGCGSWQCSCKTAHSLPFAVEGKSGSIRLRLIPAPKGKGLCVEKEIAKVLELAGIKDAWSKILGQTKNKVTLIQALEKALKQLSTTKLQHKDIENLSIVEESSTPEPVKESEDVVVEEGVIEEKTENKEESVKEAAAEEVQKPETDTPDAPVDEKAQEEAEKNIKEQE